MRQSGQADLLPSLRETVYVGVSAGSMVMAPNIGEDFVGWKPPTGGDRTLGLVDFSMFPHLDHENLPDNSMANAEKWASGVPVPGYACRRGRPLTLSTSTQRSRRGRRSLVEKVDRVAGWLPSRFRRLSRSNQRSVTEHELFERAVGYDAVVRGRYISSNHRALSRLGCS
jgi:Peptidase family S51